MKEHNLKIKWIYLIDVLEHGKNFEIRKNDRDFNKGDTVKFIPVDLCGNVIANPSIEIPTFKITYVFYGGEYGIDEDYCVFGIEQMKGESKMTDKEYQHALDLMEKGIRADERKKTIDECKKIVMAECTTCEYPFSPNCVECMTNKMEQLKEQKL